MSLTEDFQQAQVDVKQLAQRPDNDTLLRLYALYKQGSQGDVTGSRPGVFDLVGRAKYDAWKGLAGTTRDDAQQRYVDLVKQLRTGA
ncbi:acyl-CoA-binding protein [Dactylosporangium roseum]|uniref:Acyl-CoA-binding protein n=1 Tax=Dactylosporangium roseum TaxID=47989 RepID=A0ABY5YW67_9ACTN|nr:acyl-CoA-binding protein [Dactylosporangium roseum]UWZ33487.1 acyl-CoA-binding protein [Dactylosporangium roseum]